jgi:ectoine hydroxylase-related dioxygenase (phytanoyl-CoA dioxygenase family)
VTDSVPVVEADRLDDLRKQLDTWGCCIVRGAASPDTMDRVVADITPHVSEAGRGSTDFAGAGTRRTGAILRRSPTFRDELAMHPAILAAGAHVLANAPSWMLSLVGYFELFAGEPTQLLHRDIWKYGVAGLPHEIDCNGIWAVTDFTEANGATRVVPGSHLWEEEARPAADDGVAAEMSKGSLLLYTGRLFHGGGENLTDEVRIGLSVQHSAGWVAQTEQLMLECPPEVVADWSDDLARLIGYQLRGPAIGHWRDTEDPLVAVHEAREQRRA